MRLAPILVPGDKGPPRLRAATGGRPYSKATGGSRRKAAGR
jgi:hypothetical protein